MTTLSTQPIAFEDSARETLLALRSALLEVIHCVPGFRFDDETPLAEVARYLKIDRKLAWKMGKMMMAADPFEAAQNLPGAAGIEIFLKATRRSGAGEESIARARLAYEEYKRVITMHAGDKAAFEAMVSQYADEGGTRTELEHRRAAFKANAAMFGIQARVQVRADFEHPALSGRKDRSDTASVRGFVDLVRTRSDVAWPLGRLNRRFSLEEQVADRQPIDQQPIISGTNAPYATPLLYDFCSRPLPEVSLLTNESDQPEALLEPGVVGKTGAITCMTGEISRDYGPIFPKEKIRYKGLAVRCYTPCEALVCDWYIHESLFGRVEVTAECVHELYSRSQTVIKSLDDLRPMRLPMREKVLYLGRGLDAVSIPQLSKHRSLVSHVLDRFSWKPDEFLVYRLFVEYPPIPSSYLVEHSLRDSAMQL